VVKKHQLSRLDFLNLCGTVFLFWGGYQLLNDYLFFKNAVRRQGTVVNARSHFEGNRTSEHWDLNIKFDLANNNQEHITHLQTINGHFKTNDVIQLLYNPDKPDESKLDDFWDLWSDGIWRVILGLFGFSYWFQTIVRKKYWGSRKL